MSTKMNSVEKSGCKKILNKLSADDLVSLADTITHKQVKSVSRNETVEVILTFTERPIDLLKRQKVKRNVLFQYLVGERIAVSANLNKKALVGKVLESWGTVVDLTDLDVGDSDASSSNSSCQADLSQSVSKTDYHNGVAQFSGGSPQQQQQQQPSNHIHQKLVVNNIVHQVNNVTNVVTYGAPASQTGAPHSQDINPNKLLRDPVQQNLGESFTKWFYESLNSHNPVAGIKQQEFGPEHFWDDATLSVNVHTPVLSEEKFGGRMDVSQRFLTFTKQDQLLFNPNISQDGVYVRPDPHGLVKILVCGTVHRGNECLGIFQQVFGIIKDPRYDNNFKIKAARIDLKTSQVTSMPKLEGDPDSQMNILVPV